MPTGTTWLILALLALLGLFALAWYRAATRVRRANLHRQTLARAGEAEAEVVLAEAGYTVVERQVSLWWTMRVDGEPHEVLCRADLLVSRDGRDYVAEVKTGATAPNPLAPATRRQLMEYQHAFDVDGVLLVDMEARSVKRVDFA